MLSNEEGVEISAGRIFDKGRLFPADAALGIPFLVAWSLWGKSHVKQFKE